jgi:predicted acyltransferase
MAIEPGKRLLSLDIFRGLTIAGMLIVNTPGNKTAYAPLEHAEWNGCTPTDLVFPFFLFIAGTAMVFSLSKRKESGQPLNDMWPRLLRRSAIIFALGLLLNAIPNYHPSTIRFLGVLPRIALCVLVGSWLFLKTSVKGQVLTAAALIIGYWLAMTQIPVPGYGAGVITPEGSLASWIDRLVLGRHTYHQGPFDPEGVLSTLPALATTLLGMLAGHWLRAPRSGREKVFGLLLAGLPLTLAGWVWGLSFPINKSIWTSSYVLYTGGLACITLAVCFWAADVAGWRTWGKPFEVLGLNAIAAYVVPILVLKALVLTEVGDVQTRIWICDHLFGVWLEPRNASAAFALSYLTIWTAAFWALCRKNIFWKA